MCADWNGRLTFNGSTIDRQRGNLVHSISSVPPPTGQPAGLAAAMALARVGAVPNWPLMTLYSSTSNQPYLNWPGDLSALILANPGLLMSFIRQRSQTTASLAASANGLLSRIPEQTYQEMDKEMGAMDISFPSEFPKGPWKTSEEAKDCINKCFTAIPRKLAPAVELFSHFSIARSASKGSKMGNCQLLVCDHHGGTNLSQQE